MTEPTTPVDAARELTKDTLVTLTDETGTEYEGKVGRVNTHAGDDDITTVWVKDSETYDGVATLTISPDDDVVFMRGINGNRDQVECTDIETHGIQVDWDEPVGSSESGLTYVVDCPECGGLMARNGQHWRRSRESYKCSDCGHEDSWRRRSDMVRKPTRREWAEHKLTNPSPRVSIADRYIPEGYELPGYYFRIACKNDPDHYTRCRASEDGSANYHQFDDLRIGACTECGAETTSSLRTYDEGIDEWGEPEDKGDKLPEAFQSALDAVETGEFALFVPHDPSDEAWGYTYEGVSYTKPWHDYEDGGYLVLDDGDLYFDIVGMGGNYLSGSAGIQLGEVAFWAKNTDDAELVPRDEYEVHIDAPAVA